MASGYAPGPIQYNPPQQNWFSRNWKWFVPLLVLGFLSLVGGFLALIFGLLKSNEPYKHAVEVVMHDPLSTSTLGAPIQTGWLVTGSIRLNNNSGIADLAIPVRGQLHNGKVYVLAHKFAGKWSYERIILLVDDQEGQIDLLHHEQIPATEH